MGKKQHQKDKMYLTCTEWSTLYGGRKAAEAARGGKSEFKRLPFHCCSLSLQPFENPFCTRNGVVFDLMNIVPYLKKYSHNPITGEPLDAKSLVKLNFHKNSDGKYHCPVTFKIFNENSHIVAIAPTGNVFSQEAVERLNLKPKHLVDLLTDQPFKRSDIITIQDPTDLEKFNMSAFHHLRHNLAANEEDMEKARSDPNYFLRVVNPEARAALEGLYREYKPPEKKEAKKEKVTARNAAHFSTGAVAQSFTSTAQAPVTENEAAILERDVVRYRRVKKKGYVRLHTNLGDLNLELHCDLVPKTCENFLKLCSKGYYKDTVFHRSIRHFMIQGGDPSGTGKGGESCWGKPFKDEFKPNLTHTGRGVLSMANSGPNTNGSQFFVTYRSCTHLDRKHSVFGRVVGGMEALSKMERVETDDKDRPKEIIKVTGVSVFVDPFEEVDKLLEEEDRNEEEKATATKGSKSSSLEKPLKAFHSGVGKYIKPQPQSVPAASPQPIAGAKRSSGVVPDADRPKRPRAHPGVQPSSSSKGFRDFSSW